jgi:hypothetical protein
MGPVVLGLGDTMTLKLLTREAELACEHVDVTSQKGLMSHIVSFLELEEGRRQLIGRKPTLRRPFCREMGAI